MSSIKLINILSHLEAKELSSLRKFILTKTSEDSDIFTLFNYLHKNQRKIASIENISFIHKEIFSKTTLKTVANYFSILNLWTEEWIIICQVEKEVNLGEVLLIKWFNERGQYNLANLSSNTLINKIKTTDTFYPEQQNSLYSLYHNEHFSNNRNKYDLGYQSIGRVIDTYLECVNNQLMAYLIEAVNWGSITNHQIEEVESRLINILSLLPDTENTELLKDVYQLQKSPSPILFNKIFSTFLEGKLDPNSNFIKSIFIYLILSYSKIQTKGYYTDSNEMEKLYTFGFNSGLILVNGSMSSPTFFNIIVQLSNHLSYEEVNIFIDKNVHFVKNKKMESFTALMSTLNAFYHQRFDDAMKLSWRSDFETIGDRIDANFIHLMSFYCERNEENEPFKYELQKTKIFLKRNKENLSSRRYEGFNNLLSFIESRIHNKVVDHKTYDQLQYRSWCEYVSKKNI